jgi:hypothetical protein
MLCCVHHFHNPFTLKSFKVTNLIYTKPYLCQTNSLPRKTTQVNFSLWYTNVKVTVTFKLKTAHVERRVCLIGFRWWVRKRLINRHDIAWGITMGGGLTVLSLHVSVFWDVAPYTLARFARRFGKLASAILLVDIYRPLEARSVSCIRCHQ